MKKGVLKNFTNFTGKHLCQSFFFNKVTVLRPAPLLKKRLWHRCFLVNLVKFLRRLFSQNTSGGCFCKNWLMNFKIISFHCINGHFFNYSGARKNYCWKKNILKFVLNDYLFKKRIALRTSSCGRYSTVNFKILRRFLLAKAYHFWVIFYKSFLTVPTKNFLSAIRRKESV